MVKVVEAKVEEITNLISENDTIKTQIMKASEI